MAYKSTKKANNHQQHTTYILFMIISSFFHKSICNTKWLETNLFLYYREMPANRQEDLEKKIIEETEKKLQEVLPILSQMNCEVSICRRAGNYHIEFKTGFETITVVVDGKGNYQMQLSFR